LVKTKNRAVLGKHISEGLIDARYDGVLNSFYREHLNQHLNQHRSCAQPEVQIDDTGRNRIRSMR
jgi:hypothetical protein